MGSSLSKFSKLPVRKPVNSSSAPPSLIKQPPTPLYERPTTEQWSQTLNRISGTITSSTWSAQAQPVSQPDRHSAQRSSKTTQKLPVHPTSHDGADLPSKPDALPGRLSQQQIMRIFSLRREDASRWSCDAIAKAFAMDKRDALHLLQFTRTYYSHVDADGKAAAYYNPDPQNTIVAFERD